MKTFLSATLLTLLMSGMKSTHAPSDFWQQINEPFGFRIQTIAVNSSGHIFAGTYGGGIFRSLDNGNHWVSINTGLTYLHISRLAINARNDLFAGSVDGLYRSKNNGDVWVPDTTGLTNGSVSSIAIDASGHILAASYFGGIFFSTDNGESWKEVITPDSFIYDLDFSPNGHDFAATNCCRNAGVQSGSIFRSFDRGESWKRVYENGDRVNALAINRSGDIFAVGSIEAVIRSTDDGDSWESANSGLESAIVVTFATNSHKHIFAGTWWSGIFRSMDNGESWTAINSGLTNTAIWSLAIDAEDYVYIGDDSG